MILPSVGQEEEEGERGQITKLLGQKVYFLFSSRELGAHSVVYPSRFYQLVE